MKPIKISIKDIEWVFVLMSDKDYEDKNEKDSHGITHKDEQRVEFKESSLTLRLVIHELFHVYSASCCINSCDSIDRHDMEEISAEILEFHIDQIHKTAKKLYNSLKTIELKDE